MKKQIAALLCLLLLSVGLAWPGQAASAASPDYNYIALPSEALAIGGEMYLPLRHTFNSLQMKVAWRADGQNKIKLTGENSESYELLLNKAGTEITIANGNTFPCHITKGTSYLPLRLLQEIVNRQIGLSGTHVLVIMDPDPNWQMVSGTWRNQKPMWAQMNVYQKPQPQKPAVPPTTTDGNRTAPTPSVAKPNNAVVNPNGITGDKLIWPTTATYVSSPFGERIYPLGDGYQTDFHTGVDIAGRQGDPIFAAAAGVVTRASVFSTYGNCVDITHPSGLVTRYAHLNAIQVSVGQQVAQGQTIGSQGMTGAATGPHLHFETRLNDKAVDPDVYIHYR